MLTLADMRTSITIRYTDRCRVVSHTAEYGSTRTDLMEYTLELTPDTTPTGSAYDHTESTPKAAVDSAEVQNGGASGIGALRMLGVLSAFAVTLGIPALSIAVLLAVRPVLPLAQEPVSALIFVLAFTYIMAFLLAVGEMTSRPLSPRARERQPRAGVFAAGIGLALAASGMVVGAAPYVSQSLLGKGLVFLQAALCAGAFSACLITSIRLYRMWAERLGSASPTLDEAEPREEAGEAGHSSWLVIVSLRLQNGFDRGTFRALIGMGLASCAAGIGGMALLMPSALGTTASYGLGSVIFTALALISIAMVKSTRWMSVALSQWVGLLAGVNMGYYLLVDVARTPPFNLVALLIPLALFALALPLLFSHPARRDTGPSHVMHPPPEPTVSMDVFCHEAALEFGLTPREEETLLLMLESLDSHEIAAELGVSPKTAKSYIRKVRRKIGADDLDGVIDVLDAWWECDTE